MYETLQATAKAYIESYNAAHKSQDMKDLSSTLTPDCKRYFAPQTLLDLVPVLEGGRSNEQFEKQEVGIFASHDICENSITDMTVDERQSKVAIRTLHHIVTKRGVELNFEHAVTLWMIEDGTKIYKISQYGDTLMAKQFMEQNKEAADGVNSS